MHKEIAPFHYLTQDLPHYSHEEQVRVACEAGVKWVQLRVKKETFDEWLRIAQKVKAITSAFASTLIINDSVEIARLTDAEGVHLGQQDMPSYEARKILGDKKIVGVSIHSIEEFLRIKDSNIDYFGLGPFQYTGTKENLDAVLGLEGIKKVIMRIRAEGLRQPVVAIGGICLEHVHQLLDAGADGVAISSAINLSKNPQGMLRDFLKVAERVIHKYETL